MSFFEVLDTYGAPVAIGIAFVTTPACLVLYQRTVNLNDQIRDLLVESVKAHGEATATLRELTQYLKGKSGE